MPPAVLQKMNLRTAAAEKRVIADDVRTWGVVERDPSRIGRLHARVGGWVETMEVHAEGDPIAAGQRLLTLYSPELINAQEDLLHALRADTAELIQAARERLAGYGVQSRVIEQIEQKGRVLREVPWYAPQGGVLGEPALRQGQYVSAGGLLLEYVNLERVWLVAEVLAPQAATLTRGQPAVVRFRALPGQDWSAEVSHIYPELEPVQRATRVRLPLDNAEGVLRPGMWASVRLQALPDLPRLAVPREAVIRTGDAARVVVQTESDHFQVRPVTLGRGDARHMEILAGVRAGETVVTSGQFLLDSEAAVQAGGERMGGHAHH